MSRQATTLFSLGYGEDDGPKDEPSRAAGVGSGGCRGVVADELRVWFDEMAIPLALWLTAPSELVRCSSGFVAVGRSTDRELGRGLEIAWVASPWSCDQAETAQFGLCIRVV